MGEKEKEGERQPQYEEICANIWADTYTGTYIHPKNEKSGLQNVVRVGMTKNLYHDFSNFISQ